MNLKFAKLHDDAIEPTYATPGAAAFDLYATANHAAVFVGEGRPQIISTGIAVEVPDGWFLDIRSRSGHGFNSSVRLANCTGVIDSDYRGEIKICLTADAGGGMMVKPGDRIAQAILTLAPRVDLVEVDTLTRTDRGAGGFGSTGQ